MPLIAGLVVVNEDRGVRERCSSGIGDETGQRAPHNLGIRAESSEYEEGEESDDEKNLGGREVELA